MSVKTLRALVVTSAIAAIGVTGLVSASYAQNAPYPTQTSARISTSQLASKIEQAGYQIRDIDQKYYGWEVEVTDRNNQRLELRVDNQGNITGQEYDD
ncbi:PepSY domain-containing protein [Bartonella sp. HY329]|uniref:PepSY domain-containing protein n=1 Tax=unclassified Bartonella TaxID=2645622 RepID=UPI0021C946EF|nr:MULTISPECIES: PepSY domain-containing protein [unclassified Bartonella]UXM95438.1 PepSY domain-containing protein [Bartonella sp. HY329]UXN09763.1 PepSY domain-containing protein [Bartonella sp. HY328]